MTDGTRSERDQAPRPPINVTVNVQGLISAEALDLITDRVQEAIAQALDEARRLSTDVKR